MQTVQSELLRIGAKIAAEEPTIIAEHTLSRMYVGWGNNRDFSPGLRIGAVFNRRGTDFRVANIGSIFFEIDDTELGISQMTVWPDHENTDAYEGPYGETFLDAFAQYESRPHLQTPAGIAGLALQLVVVEARDLLVV